MDHKEFRVLIKHCFLIGKNAKEAKEWLDKHYPDSAPGKSTVCDWYNELKRGRSDLNDAQRSGRPKSAVNEENVMKIREIVLSDRKMKVREIAEASKLSYGSALTVLHDNLGMKKLNAKWVPRLLTPCQKQQRIDDSKACLKIFNRNKADFLRRYVTMDETWIHHYTPESKRSSAEWVEAGESIPKRPKTQQSAGKIMASVFWDAHGILFIDYLEKGKRINTEYYTALLDRLNEEIKKKRPHIAKKKTTVSPRQCAVS